MLRNNQRPVRGWKLKASCNILSKRMETINAPLGDGKRFALSDDCYIGGNNQHPARGRKRGLGVLLVGVFIETINTPPGDGNKDQVWQLIIHGETINTPLGDGNIRKSMPCLPRLETINTPLGDGNSQGISFRHCTMKKITAPPGDEAKKY